MGVDVKLISTAFRNLKGRESEAERINRFVVWSVVTVMSFARLRTAGRGTI